MAQRISKPPFSIVMLGAAGHGKTTIAEALVRRCGGRGASAANFGAKEYAFETPLRRYFIRDGLGQDGVLRGLVFGPTKPDAALLVLQPTGANDLAEQLKLLSQLGVTTLLVALNQATPLEEDALDLAEMELRELLNEQGFVGDEASFFRVWPALEIDPLLEKLESLPPTPQPRFDDFLMRIEERFTRANQDPIAAGHVLRGAVKVGDSISMVSSDGFVDSRVSALDVVVRSLNEDSIVAVGVIRERRARASQGQWISCHLTKPSRRQLDESYALARPGSLTIYREAEAIVWIEPLALEHVLLFRIRTEKGGFRRLLPEGSKLTLPVRSLQRLSLPAVGMFHLETPAYFEIIAQRLNKPVGCGVIVSLA